MKRTVTQIASGLCLTAMLAGILAGCGGTQPPSGAPSDQAAGSNATTAAEATKAPDAAAPAADGKKVEITAMLFDRSNVPEGEGTIDDNRWTKYVNEEMGKQNISVKFVPIPRSEEATKVPVMVASQTAADIMMMYNYATVKKFFDDGGTYDLAPYLANAPDLLSYLGEDVLKIGQNEKGEQYAIPARRATTTAANAFVRKDWLDKLGMAVPTTVDELYAMFKAFKEQDPGGVGSDKVVAGWWNDWILRYSFLNHLDDVKFYNVHMFNTLSGFAVDDKEGVLEYFKFRNKCYNDGLLDKEYFADSGTKEKEYMVSGVLGFWTTNVNGSVDSLRGGILQNLKKNIPTADIVSIEPIKNINDGKQYNVAYPITGALNFIPKTAKNPEACVAYLNWLAGEGGFHIFHGMEGEHYTLEGDIPVVKDAEVNAKTKDWIRHDLFLVGNQGYYKTEADFIAATAKELPEYEAYVTKNYTDAMAGNRLNDPTYNSPKQVENSANIQKVFDDYNVQMTTCTPDQVEKLFGDMMVELDKYDIKGIIAERQAFYDAAMQ